MIVILNDNEMSIAPNVGAIHSMLGRLRTAGKYQWVKDELEYLFKRFRQSGQTCRHGGTSQRQPEIHASLGNVFEELGFTYLGPVDGHSYHELIENLQYAKNERPCSPACHYEKGKGYKPAETDTVGTWHGTGPYKINTGDFVKPKAAAPSWSGLVSGTVRRMAREDGRIVAITPAMPVGSKLEGFAKEFPDRMFDVGIAEQHAATMARLWQCRG